MLSLARFGSKLLNLAVSSQDCTRNNLKRSKIQNFPGGGPPDAPMWRASQVARHCAATFSSLKTAFIAILTCKTLDARVDRSAEV